MIPTWSRTSELCSGETSGATGRGSAGTGGGGALKPGNLTWNGGGPRGCRGAGGGGGAGGAGGASGAGGGGLPAGLRRFHGRSTCKAKQRKT